MPIPAPEAAVPPAPRPALLIAALVLIVMTQAGIAYAWGDAAGPRRAEWGVAIALVVLLAGPTALLMRAVWTLRTTELSWSLGLSIVAAGLLMRLPYLWAGVLMEDDHFRYMLDGAMVAHGLNPYAHAPADLLTGVAGVPAALVEAGRASITGINFPELRSIYPGGAQALFALAHLIKPWGLDGLRLVLLAAEMLTAVLLWLLLRRLGKPVLFVALVWCNPLLAFSLTGQAHIDAALATALLAALLATHHRAGLAAGFCLGFAAAIKLWPALLAPLLVRWLWPDRRVATGFVVMLALTLAVLCGPLALSSLSARSGLVAYASGWSVNNAPYAWISISFYHWIGPGTGERLLRGLVMLIAILGSLAIARRPLAGLADLTRRAAFLAAGLFYLSPAQFPWYCAGFMPLAAASGAWGLMAASVGLPIYFLFFPLSELGLGNWHGYGIAALHLIAVLLTGWLTRRQTSPGSIA